MIGPSPVVGQKADGQTRTDDRSITSRVLYQLSYTSDLGLPILAFPCSSYYLLCCTVQYPTPQKNMDIKPKQTTLTQTPETAYGLHPGDLRESILRYSPLDWGGQFR